MRTRRVFIAALGICLVVSGCQSDEVYSAKMFAVGDSYMSGDGNPVAMTADGAVWSLDDNEARECRRSDLSAVKTALGERVTNLACSGALMSELAGVDGQIKRATNIARDESNPEIVIGAGGNDIGWSDVMTECMAADCVGSKRITAVENKVAETIEGSADAIARELERSNVFKRVWIVTYPNFAYRKKNVPCDGGSDPLYARVTPAEWREMWERSGSLLNKALRAAAARHGWSVIEMEEAFFGHSVCDEKPYVNGLEDRLSGFAHPNRDGYLKMSDIIKEAVR